MINAKRWLLPLTLGFLTTASCGSDDGTAECEAAHNWRNETLGGVVCKGVPDCLCSTDQVCSLTVTDRTTLPWDLSASCTALTAAGELAMICDGPEDCDSGQVCCARLESGGGSKCAPSKDCSGIGDERVLCRDDDDCTFPGHNCKPAAEGTFFASIVGYCD